MCSYMDASPTIAYATNFDGNEDATTVSVAGFLYLDAESESKAAKSLQGRIWVVAHELDSSGDAIVSEKALAIRLCQLKAAAPGTKVHVESVAEAIAAVMAGLTAAPPDVEITSVRPARARHPTRTFSAETSEAAAEA